LPGDSRPFDVESPGKTGTGGGWQATKRRVDGVRHDPSGRYSSRQIGTCMNPFAMARTVLRSIFASALDAVNGRRCTAAFLSAHPPARPVFLAAMGKAAAAMASGATDILGDRLSRALIVTKPGHLDGALANDSRFICLEAAHPVPDHRSLAAGEALMRFLEHAPHDAELLFLISGGTSSLVEVLPAGVTLATLQKVNLWLLGSGLPIGEINRIRQALSRIKGGRLASSLGGRDARVLMISDVPGDDPAIIGSGLLYSAAGSPVASTVLPPWLEALLARYSVARDAGAAGPGPVAHHVIARLEDALEAAAVHARGLGYPATIVPARLEGDAVAAGRAIIGHLVDQPAGIYLWGGEPTVRLPARPGRGGRCQSLALAAARELRQHGSLVLLAAGTDGTDGPGGAAGAMVDPETVTRGSARGLDARHCLDTADSGSFLAASGDLLVTGPTGTNVTDLVVALKGTRAQPAG
jgi:glycerate 2-kinase